MRDTSESRPRWAGLKWWVKARQQASETRETLEVEAARVRLEVFDRMVERRIAEICKSAREA